MRPRGEIRQALGRAAEELASPDSAPAACPTWRDMAEAACVGYAAARQTVRNMARAGELRVVGDRRLPHSRRPMACYAPTGASEPRDGGSGQQLATALQSWARG